MLVIRLARTGRTKYPTYRIVAAESARAATGKFVKILGHYNPHTKELVLDKPVIEGYVAKGAQPSNSVIRLLQRENVALPAWVKLETRNRKPKHEPEVVEAPADTPAEEAPVAVDEAPAEEVAEATAEETPAEEVVETPVAETPAEEVAPEAATEAPAAEDSTPEEPAAV